MLRRILGNVKRWYILSLLLAVHVVTWADKELIEHYGDHYVINVEALSPDSEMTLIDVLQLCPELTFGKDLLMNSNFVLLVEDIDLLLDHETFLNMVKAQEVETIDVYMNHSVSQTAGGYEGIISIWYKKADKDGTTGKMAMEGSTYGNGRLYADVKTQYGQLGTRSYALADQYYAKGDLSETGSLSMRKLVENVHVSVDWDISPSDNLKLKMFQQYLDGKENYRYDTHYEAAYRGHLGNLTLNYTHTLNDKEATLKAEAGSTFTSDKESTQEMCMAMPHFFAELSTPLLSDDLWMLAGWEIDYENTWIKELNRQQFLKNDFYLQLDYHHHPWFVTLGCRHAMLNYWERHLYGGDNGQQWSHNRNATTFIASTGYKWGRNIVQGSFSRDFYIPMFGDFYDALGESGYDVDYRTNLVWRSELRYTYQQRQWTAFGCLTHSWKTDMRTPREELTSINASITWHQGLFRLTAGANAHHQHIASGEWWNELHDNYYSLRLSPTLLLGNGLRLSSTLLYNSPQQRYETNGHLNASVKVSKSLGRSCNIYADFHDLAGMPTMSIYETVGKYRNRALTLSMTYRF